MIDNIDNMNVNTEDKASPFMKLAVTLCIGILFLFLIFVVVRIGIKNVVYEKLGIYNDFVAFFLEGDNDVHEDNPGKPVNIDWASMYPYAKEDLYVPQTQPGAAGFLDRYNGFVSAVKNQIEWYTNDGLPFQTKLTELAIGYEGLIGWKVQEQDYDAVITLKNKHLTCVCPVQNIDEHVESTVGFKKFLDGLGIELLYVMVPFKVDAQGEELPLGITDASADNSDRFLKGLGEAGMDYLDLRALEEVDGIDHYDMFYYTDHHWRSSAAIWACGKVAGELHNRYGYGYNPELFDIDNYDLEVYDDVFLGSYGRRVTLSKAAPEDFEIHFPKNDMQYHLLMPEKNVDVTGSFGDVFIDYDMLKITDYYSMDAYSSYVTLRQYLAVIENEDALDPDRKILVLRDSFGNNFGPYFAQQYGTVELLDVSSFTGSVKSYIRESKPDAVVILYNPTMLEPINWSSYTSSKFDFR